MFSLLLAVIYMAFISLGLPDFMLGSAWPVMHAQLGVPVSYAGIITMIIAGSTIVSSLLTDRLARKLGTGLLTAISVLLTALALFGFSFSTSFAMLCVISVPYGLGAGAVDAALNNYVALHYPSRHMSWLHCFWGIGAATSPYIMGACLSGGLGWNWGYRSVGIIQTVLVALLFLALPLWKKTPSASPAQPKGTRPLGLAQVLRLPGVSMVLVAFFCYCALESTAGLWASTYLVELRGIDAVTAAKFASLFYIGITVGRFACGFISEKAGDRRLIRIGGIVIACGTILVALPLQNELPALAGIVVMGLGCAPVYPSIVHSTPYNFGEENSQSVIGVQMAGAYLGSTLMPPLFGAIAQFAGMWFWPFFLLAFVALMLAMSEKLNKTVDLLRQSACK